MAKVQKNPNLMNEQEDTLIKNKSNVSSSVVKIRSLDQIISMGLSSSLIPTNTGSKGPLTDVNILPN